MKKYEKINTTLVCLLPKYITRLTARVTWNNVKCDYVMTGGNKKHPPSLLVVGSSLEFYSTVVDFLRVMLFKKVCPILLGIFVGGRLVSTCSSQCTEISYMNI